MNLIIANLEAAVSLFGSWMSKLYEVLMINPITYQNGTIWEQVGKIYDALLGPASSIMVTLFFAALVTDTGDFIKTRRADSILLTFIMLFFMAGILIGGKYILLLIFWIGREFVDKVTGTNGQNFLDMAWIEVPERVKHCVELLDAKNEVLFWVVTLLFALVIMVCGFTILMVVYARLFNIYLHFAMAPLALATVISKQTRTTFVAFMRSFVGVCLQGLVIVGMCLIFSAFSSGFNSSGEETFVTEDTVLDNYQEGNVYDMTNDEYIEYVKHESENAAKNLWEYLGQMVFMYLIMAGMIKGADSWLHQKLNL